MTTILGIESSCDETSAAICREGKIINNVIATQAVHKSYGGVVPELASRAHQKNIIPVIHQALEEASLTIHNVQAIAYTQGPGLLGALLVGSSAAKGLALALDVPLLPVHHMRAHVLAHFIEEPTPAFPFICLTVSGGHTQLVLVKDALNMEVIGQTLDDAVGEAFDKCAKMLGLSYPGGPAIDQHAQNGDPHRFTFGETQLEGLNYSFSGIKTGVLYFLRESVQKNTDFIEQNLPDLCASIQYQLVQMLIKKLLLAVDKTQIKQVAIAGGVAANRLLRSTLYELGIKQGWEVYIPDFQYCTDNAGMIAMAGYLQYNKHQFGLLTDSPAPRMPF